MGRKIRTDVPQVKDNFIPEWKHLQNFRILDEKYKQTQKENYDRRHGVRTLPLLPQNQTVWVDTRGHQVPGQVSREANTARSYFIETPSGELRRNRAHLRVRTNLQPMREAVEVPTTTGEPTTTDSRPLTRSQTGTAIHPPDRLQYA